MAVLLLMLPWAAAQTAAHSAAADIKTVELAVTADHPRLLMNDKEFSKYRKRVNSSVNRSLTAMHDSYIQWADRIVEEGKVPEFKKDASGKLLKVSRDALGQITACSYAYRFTKDPKYLNHAELVLNQVCDFESWNPRHFLDVAEMALGVAIGYDWLYRKLDEQTREKCEKAIRRCLFDCTGGSQRKRFHLANNWGQVLNSSLLCSAVAFYDTDPEKCAGYIRRAVMDSQELMKNLYAPDGIYPEGVIYWDYGTSFSIMMNAVLEQHYGTDFGLSECTGFRKSAWFQVFSRGNTGIPFNWSDSTTEDRYHPSLWYFAYKCSDGSMVYVENEKILSDKKFRFRERLGVIFLYYASRCRAKDIVPSESLYYSGLGTNPLVMARTGWKRADAYLGVKGGGACNNHSHLDAGSFVFELDGIRWACDPPYPGYAKSENALRTIDGTPWNRKQSSYRWKIRGYNNLQHSTLTINGKDHDCRGVATLEESIDMPDRKGGRFHLTGIFQEEAAYVDRTVCMCDGEWLEVVDEITALEGKDADVYWNMATQAVSEITPEGIVLKAGNGSRMLLRAEGAEVEYCMGQRIPSGVPDCLMPFYEEDKTNYVGFTFTVPAGQDARVRVTLKKL